MVFRALMGGEAEAGPSGAGAGGARAGAVYCKPRQGRERPTRHLMLAGVGPAARGGAGWDAVRGAVLAAASGGREQGQGGGLVSMLVPDPGRALCFVSLDSIEVAEAVREAFGGGRSWAELGGQTPLVRFAELVSDMEQERGPAPEEIEQPTCHVDVRNLGVPGLILLKDFITATEELELVSGADANASAWHSLAKRRVQHYGYDFCYVRRNIDMSRPARELPCWVNFLLARFKGLPELEGQDFDQLTVNEYLKGTGINPHVDSHSAFSGAVLSLSCSGGVVMEFQRGLRRVGLLLPPRSLLILSGEARYAWRHYIPSRRSDIVKGIEVERGDRRLSFTFRLARGFPCRDCGFPAECDSSGGGAPPTRLETLGLRAGGAAPKG